MGNLNTALLLMVVGMTTVFTILLIIIYLSKFLIYLVNKYAPQEEMVKPAAPDSSLIPPHITAAIQAAVNVVTHNKGKIIKIEKQK